MSSTTPDVRRLGRADHPSNPGQHHRADFARAATIAAFGRHGWALDHGDFVDRLPDQASRRIDARPAGRAA